MVHIDLSRTHIRVGIHNDNPYFARTGELWDVFCEDLRRVLWRYNGTLLYIVSGIGHHMSHWYLKKIRRGYHSINLETIQISLKCFPCWYISYKQHLIRQFTNPTDTFLVRVNLPVPRPGYSGKTGLISWLLVPWHIESLISSPAMDFTTWNIWIIAYHR